MRKPITLQPGDVIGRWTLLIMFRNSHGTRKWRCRCTCGTEKDQFEQNLTRGQTRSCGCRLGENISAAKIRHGQARGKKTKEYRIWANMLTRCFNKNARFYKDYGGRGITVCDRWKKSFESFFADMGSCPGPGHSLDRFPNNNGNYEPGNCRWATKREQAANTRRNRRLTWQEGERHLAEWARLTGLNKSTIQGRLRRGWSVAEALTKEER